MQQDQNIDEINRRYHAYEEAYMFEVGQQVKTIGEFHQDKVGILEERRMLYLEIILGHMTDQYSDHAHT